MPNRNVSIYRKVLTPEQTIRYCRVIMRGKDPHPKKVEFRGLIFEADEGDYYLAYRNPRQKWERVGGDPKAAKFAADKKRAELASIATGRETRTLNATWALPMPRAKVLLKIKRRPSSGFVKQHYRVMP
jgi:hypothetical protein